MTKTINIYLTKDEKQKAHKIQSKYKVSLTTIADVIIWVSYYALLHYSKVLKANDQLANNYIENKGTKTSIKTPKCLKENELMTCLIGNKAMIYTTNVLRLYLNKTIKEYLTEEGINYYWNKCDQKLQEIQERFWDYNNFTRMTRRNLKENKEYYKKAIAEMEGRQ